MLGSLDQVHTIATQVSHAAGVVVVSVDYRLAPEHPFPAAPEDCFAAVQWVADHASDLGVDPHRLAVMGESAGGNLAAVVCLMSRDRQGPPIVHQTLIYAATDLTWRSPSVDTETNHGLLPRCQLVEMGKTYLGEHEPTDWRASPLHAGDHRALPPAHILVAEHDTLRDDGIRYADKLRTAGVQVRLSNYVGMAHGFINLNLTPTMRRHALADIVQDLQTFTSTDNRRRCGEPP